MRIFQHQYDACILRLATGIVAIKNESKEHKLPDAETNRCVRLWCGIFANEFKLDLNTIIQETTSLIKMLSKTQVESKEFRLEVARSRANLVDHNMLPKAS